MADLHALSVQESLNSMGTGGEWSVLSATNAGASSDVTNTIHQVLTRKTATLGIYSNVEIYYNFSASQTDVNATRDLIIAANTQFFITVPRGIGDTIYFNYNSTGSAGAIRIVEI
tara:strand:- start:495 stop:839 length:345 start_codon:yes stop_codon:yes gene_type:complete